MGKNKMTEWMRKGKKGGRATTVILILEAAVRKATSPPPREVWTNNTVAADDHMNGGRCHETRGYTGSTGRIKRTGWSRRTVCEAAGLPPTSLPSRDPEHTQMMAWLILTGFAFTEGDLLNLGTWINDLTCNWNVWFALLRSTQDTWR